MTRRTVIKHRAPNGALRLFEGYTVGGLTDVIKHRAPNGALRLEHMGIPMRLLVWVIKHRAPNGALRPRVSR